MSKKLVFSLFILLVGWAGVRDVHAGTAVIIQPVSASGVHTIIGTDIFLPPGPQQVRLEFRIAGWGDRELKTVQVRFESAGFDNGTVPLEHAIVPCPSNNNAGHNFCAQALETGSRCEVGCEVGSTMGCQCQSGFLNRTRTDFVGFGINYVGAADTSSPNYRMGITTSPPDIVTDSGVSMYIGTMFVTVPVGAQGTYNLDVSPSGTFLLDTGLAGKNTIPIELYNAARIIIGNPVAAGSRYVAFKPEEPGELTAVRVALTSLYHPGPPVGAGEDRDFGALEGQVRWLGPPGTFLNTVPGSTFLAAPLQCTPHFADWGAMGTIQVFGDTIIPSSVYTLQQIPISCQNNPNHPSCFGPAQILHTGQWGDAAAPFARSDQAAQPDAADLAVMVDAFRGVLSAAPKSLTQLQGDIPDPAAKINFIDVFLAVNAARGMPYPYPVPPSCP